jgi:PKD repeat protein
MKLLNLTAIILIALSFGGCSKSPQPTNSGSTNNPSSPSNPSNPSAPASPVANFTYTGGSVAPATIIFTNTSTNATLYAWDFGDGSGISTVASPSHTYTQSGTYTVSLSAGNGSTNSTATHSITITAPVGVTTLKVPISGGVGSGVNVYLFTSKAAWDNYVYGTSGSYAYTAATASNGVATFTGINAGVYWYFATSGCQNSYADSLWSTGVALNATATSDIISLAGYGTLTIENTNSIIKADVYVDGVFIAALPAGTTTVPPVLYVSSAIGHTVVAKEVTLGVENGITQSKAAYITCGQNTTVQVNP